MNSCIQIRRMVRDDVEVIFKTLENEEIGMPMDYIKKCWKENETGERATLVAYFDQQFAGWLHLLSKSLYPHFEEEGIPEINNFDVVPSLRRIGIGNALMDAIEEVAFAKFGIVGVGVGLSYNYGNAQRLYVKRGYIPDGKGVFYQGKQVEPGNFVKVGDDPVLYLTKERTDSKSLVIRN